MPTLRGDSKQYTLPSVLAHPWARRSLMSDSMGVHLAPRGFEWIIITLFSSRSTSLLLAVIHWASLRGDRKCISQTYFTDHFIGLVFPEIHFGQCYWRNYLQMCTGAHYPSFSDALSRDPVSRGSCGFVVGDWPQCIGMLPLLRDIWKKRAPQERWKLRGMRDIVSSNTRVPGHNSVLIHLDQLSCTVHPLSQKKKKIVLLTTH